MASASAYALLFLSLPFLVAAQAPTPAPVAAPKAAPVAAPKAAPVAAPKAAPVAAPTPAVPNPAEILANDGRFTTLITFLTQQNLLTPVVNRLTTVGISIFAPTDAAFKKIEAVTKTLSSDNITTILLYHGLDKYIPFTGLDAEKNPFATLAAKLTLNFTGAGDNRNVTTGVTNTKVEDALYDSSPLAIFPIEDVLIPPTFAPAPAPGPAPPKASGPSAATAGAPKVAPPPPNAAAGMQRVGWGLLVGGVVACMSLF